MLLQNDLGKTNYGQNEPSVLNYVEIVMKKWRFIVCSTISAAVTSIIIVLIMDPIYNSTVKILPPQQDSLNIIGMMLGGVATGTSSLATSILGMVTPADQYASMLESERISDAIIDKFHLMEVYKKKYRVDMHMKLDKLVDIEAGKKDGIITITVEDKDPKRAADIANAYVEELEKMTVEMNNIGGNKNRVFLEKRLAKSQLDLEKAEIEIKTFQKKYKMLNVPEQAKASIAEIAALQGQLALQEINLASLARRFTDNSQEVRDAKFAIAKLKEQILKLEGSGYGGVIPPVGSFPDMGQEYVKLLREVKIQETLVELLAKQFELAKLSEVKDVNVIQVVQSAKVQDKKVKPKRVKIVVISTLFILIISIIAAFVHDYYNNLSLDVKIDIKRMLSYMSPKLASKL